MAVFPCDRILLRVFVISPTAPGVGVSESRPLDTRPSLLVRLRDPADADAWERFLRIYGRLIYADCRRRGLGDADAEDVSQEIFGRVVRAIRTFEYRPDVGRFRDWLGAITRNEVRRFLARRPGPETLVGEPTDAGTDPGWEELFQERILGEGLAAIRGEFAATTWQAFEATWLRREPVPEVAARLGVTLASVYLAKSRVLRRLNEAVRDLADDWPLVE